ncbi:hypothetical protein G0029_06695 [Acinetobacter sp. YH12138]|uniref:hypothetical protein n=1 Tax=Acinetobacter sp. YH12138 TaxID=2601122 RepID=UPI0015D0DDB5|nr:hypothetical protein [Acinetobacter sp. YH12138]QOW49508.1 hypothetical protein G0029_06695 [Acinetobacter sp. YH12138]
MKKLLAIGTLSLISSLALADKPLLIQQGTPEPMSSYETPVAETQYTPLQPTRYKNETALNASLMLEYSAQKGKFANDIDEDLKGFGIGISSTPHRNGYWGKFEYQQSDNYDGSAYEFSFGGHLNLINANGFYALATVGTGVSILEADGFDNSTYWTLPVGLELGYTPMPNLSVYGGVGYKWSWDISSSTTCKDGTTSNSVGSGTCSSHDGIDHYNYTIGDYDGMTYKAGLRYNF